MENVEILKEITFWRRWTLVLTFTVMLIGVLEIPTVRKHGDETEKELRKELKKLKLHIHDYSTGKAVTKEYEEL